MKRHPFPVFVIASLIALVAAACTPAPAPRSLAPALTAATSAPSGRLVFDDEFDGPLDTSTWAPEHSSFGDANHEMECNSPTNVTTSGGSLLITARRENVVCPPYDSPRAFTSGFVSTGAAGQWFPMYGRYEVRAEIPHGQGLWPAIWLQHRNGASVAEVDLMEAFQSQNPGQSRSTLHSDGRINLSSVNSPLEPESGVSGWHTYSVDIEPDPAGVSFAFAIDGQVVHSYVDTEHHWTQGVDPQATWNITLNMAVGGDWVGDPDGALGVLPNGTCAEVWAALPPCPTTGIVAAQFPSTYAVDWVRVYAPS